MSKSNSVGTKLIVNSKPVGGVNSISGIKITADTIDVTDFDNATGYRDKLPGWKDTENPTASGFLDGANAGQDECNTLLDSGEVVPCEIRFPAKIGKSWYFNASIVSFSTEANIDDAITFEAEFAVSGKPSLEATRQESSGQSDGQTTGGQAGNGGEP